jgi:hypothetical protein
MASVVLELLPNSIVFGLMDVGRETQCHHQSHGLAKPQVRKLKNAEQQLIGALHLHPLIREHPACFLSFATAAECKAVMFVCDTDLAMKEAMGYAYILEGIRDL